MQLRFLLAPTINGWTTCYPERHGQDDEPTRALASELRLDIFHVLLHDSDVFSYGFFRNGELADEFVSIPDYSCPVTEEVRARQSGDPTRYQDLLDSPEQLTGLRKQLTHILSENDDAEERLATFANTLGLPNVLTSFEDLLDGTTSGIKRRREFVRVPDPQFARGEKRRANAAVTSEIHRLKKTGVLCASVTQKIEAGQMFPPSPALCPDEAGGFLACWSNVTEGPAEVVRHRAPWPDITERTGILLDRRVYSLALSSSGRFLAAGFAAGKWDAELWDVRESQMIARIPAARAVSFVGFTQGESTLMVRSEGTLGFYSTVDGREIDTVACSPDSVGIVAIHPSQPIMIVADRDVLTIRDSVSRDVVKRLLVGGPLDLTMEMLRECRHRMKLMPSPQLREYLEKLEREVSRPSRPYIDRPPDQTRGTESLRDVQLNGDGSLLAIATVIGTRVFTWDSIMSAERDMPVPLISVDAEPALFGSRGHQNVHASSYACAFDDARRQLLFCGMEGTLRSIDLVSRSTRTLVEVPGKPILTRLVLSRDGRMVGCSFKKDFYDADSKSPCFFQIWDLKKLSSG